MTKYDLAIAFSVAAMLSGTAALYLAWSIPDREIAESYACGAIDFWNAGTHKEKQPLCEAQRTIAAKFQLSNY